MKQKTIIQFWGHHNIGKSDTIKIVHEELIIKYINPTHSYTLPFPPPNHDINTHIFCKGYKIGIESMGDYLYAYGLNTRLDNYVTVDNCDMLICASRVYNDVSRHIEHLANTYSYRLLKVTNYKDQLGMFSKDDLNRLSAQHIVSLTDAVLTGSI